MNIKPLFFSLATAYSCGAIADTNLEYYEEGDDFSNEVVSVLQVRTTDTSPAVLFLSCNPDSGLSVQLSTMDVIFPDDLEGNRMILSTTHKFEESPEAVTTDWHMVMMEYKDSWYRGDENSFIEEAKNSSQLNIRLNKKNKVYRFKLDGASSYISKILDRC